jgi:hypothetical protein
MTDCSRIVTLKLNIVFGSHRLLLSDCYLKLRYMITVSVVGTVQIFGNNFWTNQNSIHDEVKCRLKLGSACYHSVQYCLSCSLLFKYINIYRTVILPVVLYEYETWSLTFREKCRLREFENRVLRKILGSKRGKVIGEWRKLRNEELNNLYCSPNIIRVIK